MVIGLAIIIANIIVFVIGSYQYDKEIGSYWKLADKSSTVLEKAKQIDKFVGALEKVNLRGGYDAIFLKTPNNSFDSNFEALKTLQQRLHEIKYMDVSSFEYQTAMQQITAQEQGGAFDMLRVFKGIWWKEYCILLWNWIAWIQILLACSITLIGFIGYVKETDWWQTLWLF